MKEKIERFSKGDFEYELPFICLSEGDIKITAEAGKKISGSLTVSNNRARQMKGFIYSSNLLLKVTDSAFHGTDTIIHYEINTTLLREGDVIEGELYIISDCGERTVPFTVPIMNSCFATSLGKISDLFQFTNLARADWSEAKKVFRSEHFEVNLLGNEDRLRFIYRNLMKSISTSQALEEFLVTIKKKSTILLVINKNELEYQVADTAIMDKLILTKNNWGFAEIRVSTDASFIELDQKFLWADRFIGNTHQISFSVQPKNLAKGIHYGHIFIKTSHQIITVKVICRYQRQDQKISVSRLLHKTWFGLVNNYLSFRMNRNSLNEYIEETQELLKHLPGPEVSSCKELFLIHLAILSGKTKIAEELLTDIATEELLLKKKSPQEYCVYLYMKALYTKEDEVLKVTTGTIRQYYEKINNDWTILWLLLNIDKRYEKNKSLKLVDIKEQFALGCRSPILYYEAICIYNEEPNLLRELNNFEIQILNYGIKNWLLRKETAQQYVYLSNKCKSFHPVVFRCLEKLYDDYETKEVLSAICCILIKGMKKSEEFFKWYRLGVESQLRITELYEYYMYSISMTKQEPIASQVLLYFIYNSSLSDKKKAYLYAHIVRNKEKNETIYRSYHKRMEIFATKMLEGHYISRDLAVLYQEFMNRSTLSSDLAKLLPYVIYRNELFCDNPNIASVVVVHKEMGMEVIVPLVNQKAQIDIYTSNAEIILVDSLGNRFIETIEYNLTPYLNSEEYEELCSIHSNHPMLLLHLFDRYQSYRITHAKAINLRRKILSLEGLSKEYVTACYQTLIDYYYENYDDELLEHYLDRLDLKEVRPAQRPKYIENMVMRSFHEKAIKALETYGMEGIGINRLIKLCSSWMLRPEADRKNDFMVSLCYYIYSHRKYDDALLSYLIKYYTGSSREMYKLWMAAREFELDTHALEERLLTQMLFTESYINDSFLVFNTYYKEVTNHMLIRAFLSFFSYKYLIHDFVIDEQIFLIIKRELYYEENDICLLAWLKHQSGNQNLTDQEKIFAEYNIQCFMRKGVVLPFFQDYKNQINLPDRILNRCFITYCSDPKNQVYLHYRLLKNDSSDYITERIPNIFMGIHLKEMLLFYHETIQYYITVEADDGNNITESFHISYEGETPKEDDSKYNQINLMLIAKEMNDDHTLHELVENYSKKEYMIAACFTPLE